MTISTTASQTVALGDGVNTVFDFNFVADSTSDIEVIYTNASGIQTTLTSSQYLLIINPAAVGQIWGIGGSVTYPLVGSPIAVGTSLTIQRILPLTQDITISNQGDFAPQVIEEMGDTLEMQIQQIAARTGQLRGTWVSGVSYTYGDMVVDGAAGANTGNIYLCVIANTSGVWATDLAAGDWTLALNVQGIANALPQISNNRVFANISGGTATPTGVTMSALIDSTIGSVQGDILYRGGALWSVLAPGTAGQVLQSGGAGANPSWLTVSGSGTVTSIATNNGLTGGTITTAGTLGLAAIANNSVLANVSGGALAPSATTLSALIDAAISSTQGTILYRGASTWSALAPGTSGQFLQTAGAAANPAWATVGASSVAYGAISGFLPSSIAGTSTTGSLTVGTGQATDSTNATYISKGTTTSWAVSNGNAINGYSGGTTLPNSSTIHFFICSGGSGTGTFASTSLTPTFPTGYTTYTRRIFSLNTNSSGALLPGTAIESEGGGMIFWLTTQILDVSTTSLNTNQNLFTLTVPSGIKVSLMYRLNMRHTNPANIIVTSGDETDVAPLNPTSINGILNYFTLVPGYDLSVTGATITSSDIVKRDGLLTTNTSGQIGARADGSGVGFYLVTRGFRDFRRA